MDGKDFHGYSIDSRRLTAGRRILLYHKRTRGKRLLAGIDKVGGLG